MLVKPALPGTIIRDPATRRILPDEGANVSDSSFWRRRILAGEALAVPDPPDEDADIEEEKEDEGVPPPAPTTEPPPAEAPPMEAPGSSG